MSWKGDSLIQLPLWMQRVCWENNDILKYHYNYLNRHINREFFLINIISKKKEVDTRNEGKWECSIQKAEFVFSSHALHQQT